MPTDAATDHDPLAAAVKTEARAAGFDLCGIATSETFEPEGAALARWVAAGRHGGSRRTGRFEPEGAALARWVAAGHHGGMAYMARNAPRSPHPRAIEPEARALVVVGLYYGEAAPLGRPWEAPGSDDEAAGGIPTEATGTPRGRISRYAWGDDYHAVMEPRLKRLAAFLVSRGARVARYYVDTGPVIDRAAARRAGLGWFGKNTLIITRSGHGSWVFLGEILTDLALVPDPPARGDCGRCRLCLDACPTGAIVAPYTVDARKCISYLTIEHRGPIPAAMRPLIGDRIFGCDVCQTVCPHNTKTLARTHPEFAPRAEAGARPELIPLLNIGDAEFRRRFAGSPVTRTKRRGLRRNVAVALGNLGDPHAVPALVRALGDEDDPVVRGHAAWALGRIGTGDAREGLRARLALEQDAEVRGEIADALAAPAR